MLARIKKKNHKIHKIFVEEIFWNKNKVKKKGTFEKEEMQKMEEKKVHDGLSTSKHRQTSFTVTKSFVVPFHRCLLLV